MLPTSILLILSYTFQNSAVLGESPPVIASLGVPWTRSEQLELLEYVYSGDPLSYVELLETWSPTDSVETLKQKLGLGKLSQSSHDVDMYLKERLLEWSLATREFAPMVEAQRQYFESEFGSHAKRNLTCGGSFVLAQDRMLCANERIDRVAWLSDCSASVDMFPFDHQVHRRFVRSPSMVMFFDPSDTDSSILFRALLDTGCGFVVRHRLPVVSRERNLPMSSFERGFQLQGFTVRLELKNTEYAAHDDEGWKTAAADEAKATEDHHSSIVPGTDSALIESTQRPLIAPKESVFWLPVAILDATRAASEPFQTFMDLTSNLPSRLQSLKRPTEEHLRAEYSGIGRLPEIIRSRGWLFTVNDLLIPDAILDPINLGTLVRVELLYQNLQRDVLPEDLPKLSSYALGKPVEELRVWPAEEMAIKWINDVERDAQWAIAPSSLREAFMMTLYGRPFMVRRNVLRMIVFVDFAKWEGVELLEALHRMVEKRPIQVGVVPLVERTTCRRCQRTKFYAVFRILWDFLGFEATKKATKHIFHIQDPVEASTELRQTFSHFVSAEIGILRDSDFGKELLKRPEDPFSWVMKESEDTRAILSRARELNERMDLDENGDFVLNGRVGRIQVSGMSVEGDLAIEKLYRDSVHELLELFQRGIPDTHIWREVLGPTLFTRRDRFVFGTLKLPELFNSGLAVGSVLENYANLAWFSVQETRSSKHNFLLVTDVNENPEDVLHAARFLSHPTAREVRLAIIHNPVGGEPSVNIRYAFWECGRTPKSLEDLFAGKARTVRSPASVGLQPNLPDDVQILKMFPALSPGRRGVIANGRLIGPFPKARLFDEESWDSLLDYEDRIRSPDVIYGPRSFLVATAFEQFLQSFGGRLDSPVRRLPKKLSEELTPNTPISYFGGESPHELRLDCRVFVDPLDSHAPILATLFNELRNFPNTRLNLTIVPMTRGPGDPVSPPVTKNYYRHQFKLQRLDDYSLIFENLHPGTLFSLALEVPRRWHAIAVDSSHDLDNIILKGLRAPVTARFELSNLLVEGHVTDQNGMHAAGLQFEICERDGPAKAYSDTVVMANLGYMQLKANPGVWELRMLPTAEDDDRAYLAEFNRQLTISSFNGLEILPQIRQVQRVDQRGAKIPGQMMPRVSYISKALESLRNYLSGKRGKSVQPKGTIHVFSVASGHLYERFLGIMIQSLIDHTDSPVKLWVLADFTSPEFRGFLPHLAREFRFDYQFVSYKWPFWLRGQTERQRLIWGYKILFLDVLFPLNLERVIFVDSDQIVRADMAELMSMDLRGAPYAYTPFCDDRPETDGLRFWKHGYWKQHLHDKQYHISALYVVDLKTFREMRAGDKLRAHYQRLSADPNSLANLDQDLPNDIQNILPIHSLPLDWLWCETWCSDASLSSAKTIDLCNNPLTKEPKLARAKRIAPEWSVYDSRIQYLKKAVFREKQ